MRKNAILLVALFVSQLLTVWPNWTQATEAAEDREYPAPSTLIPKAKNGDIWSQFTLGYIYSHGKGVGADYKKALKWVDWFNHRRILEPIGNIPPAEAEQNYYAALDKIPKAA